MAINHSICGTGHRHSCRNAPPERIARAGRADFYRVPPPPGWGPATASARIALFSSQRAAQIQSVLVRAQSPYNTRHRRVVKQKNAGKTTFVGPRLTLGPSPTVEQRFIAPCHYDTCAGAVLSSEEPEVGLYELSRQCLAARTRARACPLHPRDCSRDQVPFRRRYGRLRWAAFRAGPRQWRGLRAAGLR